MHERGGPEPVLAKDLLVIMRAALTATVGMMDAALGRCPERDGHLQRPDRQITLHAVANRPTDNAPGMQIQDHSQIKPTFTRP
ncbi:MAG: hypothetical protein ACJA1F_002804, partial [Paracoccaceae bacterium]